MFAMGIGLAATLAMICTMAYTASATGIELHLPDWIGSDTSGFVITADTIRGRGMSIQPGQAVQNANGTVSPATIRLGMSEVELINMKITKTVDLRQVISRIGGPTDWNGIRITFEGNEIPSVGIEWGADLSSLNSMRADYIGLEMSADGQLAASTVVLRNPQLSVRKTWSKTMRIPGLKVTAEPMVITE